MKIKDLVVGNNCEITLVVKSAIARETKAKKPYLALEFYDGTDTISGNYWDWTSGNIPANNTILDVSAQVTEWAGNVQLNIKGMKTNTERVLADFAPSSGYDIAQTYKDAYELMSSIKDYALRTISCNLLEVLMDKWLTVPAASGVHHAFVGGTLVHSYNVAKIAESIAAVTPDANRDLCIAGGMLHDIGKLYTYYMDGITIKVSDAGQMYDHIFMGAEFVGNYADEVLNMDNYANAHKVMMLRHIILSHHGKLEYGSPVTPKSIEAIIVSAADGIDSSAEQIREAARKVPDSLKWTDKIYTLNNRPHLTPRYVKTIMEDLEEEIL